MLKQHKIARLEFTSLWLSQLLNMVAKPCKVIPYLYDVEKTHAKLDKDENSRQNVKKYFGLGSCLQGR
jgi:hypothetical protein